MGIGAINLAGAHIAQKFTGKALEQRDQQSDQAPAPRAQQNHSANQPRSIDFQKALANFVSKAPQGITAQAAGNAAEARRNLGSLMAKPQAA